MRRLLCLATLLCLVTSVHAQTATLAGDPAHPAAAKDWVKTELYFGLGPADAPEKGVNDATWRAFLDREVTVRFPAGLTVLDIYGQWQSKRDQTTPKAHPERIRSKLLILLHPATPENAAKVDAIRTAWKQLSGDQSVLEVTQPAGVSF